MKMFSKNEVRKFLKTFVFILIVLLTLEILSIILWVIGLIDFFGLFAPFYSFILHLIFIPIFLNIYISLSLSHLIKKYISFLMGFCLIVGILIVSMKLDFLFWGLSSALDVPYLKWNHFILHPDNETLNIIDFERHGGIIVGTFISGLLLIKPIRTYLIVIYDWFETKNFIQLKRNI